MVSSDYQLCAGMRMCTRVRIDMDGYGKLCTYAAHLLVDLFHTESLDDLRTKALMFPPHRPTFPNRHKRFVQLASSMGKPFVLKVVAWPLAKGVLDNLKMLC